MKLIALSIIQESTLQAGWLGQSSLPGEQEHTWTVKSMVSPGQILLLTASTPAHHF